MMRQAFKTKKTALATAVMVGLLSFGVMATGFAAPVEGISYSDGVLTPGTNGYIEASDIFANGGGSALNATVANLETALRGNISAVEVRVTAAEDAINASKDRIKALEDADFQGQIDDLTDKKLDKSEFNSVKTQITDAIAASSDRIKALEDADFQGQIDDTQTYVNGEVARLDEKTNANSKAINASKDRINGLDSRVTQNEKDIKTNADNIKELDGRVTQNENDIADLKASTSADLTAVNHRIDNVDSKINKVGAGAAALAALHPMDTDGKFSMAAGFGNYRDANAMALGMFYRPNDQVMFSMGGSLGNGENLLNVGVSFALDKGVNTSKAAMAKKINVLEEENKAIRAENAEQKAEIQELKEALARIEAKLAK